MARLTANLFDRNQGDPPEHQLLALACAFTLMLETCRFNAGDAFAAASNLMRDETNSTRRHATFDAMRFHLDTHMLQEGAHD